MIFDFIMKIPYYIALLFIPNFMWEFWVEELKNKKKEIPKDMVSSEKTISDLCKEIKLHNRKLENSIVGRLVLTRWPYSVYFD